jgi:hypothetical protein
VEYPTFATGTLIHAATVKLPAAKLVFDPEAPLKYVPLVGGLEALACDALVK